MCESSYMPRVQIQSCSKPNYSLHGFNIYLKIKEKSPNWEKIERKFCIPVYQSDEGGAAQFAETFSFHNPRAQFSLIPLLLRCTHSSPSLCLPHFQCLYFPLPQGSSTAVLCVLVGTFGHGFHWQSSLWDGAATEHCSLSEAWTATEPQHLVATSLLGHTSLSSAMHRHLPFHESPGCVIIMLANPHCNWSSAFARLLGSVRTQNCLHPYRFSVLSPTIPALIKAFVEANSAQTKNRIFSGPDH